MLKDISLPDKQRKFHGIHIEAPGCIINIRPYLTTMEGKKVTSIEIIPDKKEVGVFPDFPNRKGINIRVYHKED